MNATQIITWPKEMKPTEWPKGTLSHMNFNLFVNGVFPLRKLSGIPMWPSSLYEAHVRHDESESRHSTENHQRLADATDLHVSTVERMLRVMEAACRINEIGGIGIYFDTNTPMIHIDMRPLRLVWLRTKKGKYVYRENDIIEFYRVLAQELEV